MKRNRVWVILAFILVSLTSLAADCTGDDDENELYEKGCGPCGQISTGDTTISGNAAIDGYFGATGALNFTYARLHAEFETHVRQLATAYEIKNAATTNLDTLVNATVSKIKKEFNDNLEGGMKDGLKINYSKPLCMVNAQAALAAQAACENKSGCNVGRDCTGNQLSFECRGVCQGNCSGNCDLLMCNIELDDELRCEGECTGLCVHTKYDGKCDGICEGDCEGNCSAFIEDDDDDDDTSDDDDDTTDDMDGWMCNGACDEDCDGNCKIPVNGESCSGECEGECKIRYRAGVKCIGDIECLGHCDGRCSGNCEGEIKMPKCEGSADCAESLKCEPQAQANAAVQATCTSPVLDLVYVLDRGLINDEEDRARFVGKLQAFKIHMVGILRSMENMRVLYEGGAASEIGVEPPVLSIRDDITHLRTINLDPKDDDIVPEYEVVRPLVPCTTNAFNEAIDILNGLSGRMSATVAAQRKFSDLLLI